jgi:hypothetical protein
MHSGVAHAACVLRPLAKCIIIVHHISENKWHAILMQTVADAFAFFPSKSDILLSKVEQTVGDAFAFFSLQI